MSNPVEEFLKHAGLWDTLKGMKDAFIRGASGNRPNMPFREAVSEQVGGAIPNTLIGGAVALGGLGAMKGIGAIRERFSKARDFKDMMSMHPALGEHDAGEVQAMYNSLRSMSPTMAKDPMIAGSFVREMLAKRPEQGAAVPTATAKLLAETERNISQSAPQNPLLSLLARPQQVGPHPDYLQQQRMDLEGTRAEQAFENMRELEDIRFGNQLQMKDYQNQIKSLQGQLEAARRQR